MSSDVDLEPGASGAAVTDLQDALASLTEEVALADFLGQAGVARAFAAERARASYGEVTQKAVSILQNDHDLEASGYFDAPTRDLLRRLVGEEAAPVDADQGRVTGAVVDQFGFGRARVALSLRQLRFGTEESEIGASTSRGDGSFALTYDRARLLTRQGQVHLRVVALGGDKALGRTAAILNAPPAVGNLMVVAPLEERGLSEFERLDADISGAARRAGIDVAGLTEDPDRPDISLLAAETGHSAARVALLVAARRVEAASDGAVAPALVYALGAAGLSVTAAALGGASEALLKRRVARAVKRGLVPADTVETLAAGLDAARRQLRVTAAEGVRQGQISQQLAGALGSDALRDRFLAAVEKHPDDIAAFWAAAEGDAQLAPHVEAARFVFQSNAVAGGEAPVAAMLQKARADGEIATTEDLVHWRAADWAAALKAAGVPLPETARAVEPDKLRLAQARGFEQAVELTHPAAFARVRIAASGLAARDAITAFLDAVPAFDLRSERPRAVMAANPAPAGALTRDGARTLDELARVVRVTGQIEPAIALVADGHTSARAIAGMGPALFARTYGEALGGIARALEVHAAAGQVAWTANELIIQASPQSAANALSVTPQGGATAIPAMPDWATLFGAEDSCACSDCQSVTSPAAYLVDVLRFLGLRPSKVAGKSALAILTAPGRRPDIVEMELSCDNSHVALPQIDLVIEMLSDAVAPLPPFDAAAVAGPIETLPGTHLIAPATRDRLNAALGYARPAALPAGAPWPAGAFAIGPDAMLVSEGDGQPLVGAKPAWRVEDALATYALRTQADGSIRVTARMRSTRGPSAERLTTPQYRNAEAQRRLAEAYYPWRMPYDTQRVLARHAATQLGTTLGNILDIRGGDPVARWTALPTVREALGLSPVDHALVVWAAGPGLDLAQPWRHWGFGAETATAANPIPDPENATQDIADGRNWRAILGTRIDVLIQQAQIDYATLLDLVDTLYVNPVAGAVRQLSIVSTDPADPATCRLSRLSLAGLDDAAAIRIARLQRLAMRSGLTPREIDQALTARAAAVLDAPMLVDLSLMQRLRTRLGLDWDELAATLTAPDPARIAAAYAPPPLARPVDRTEDKSRYAPTLYERLCARPGGAGWFPADPAALGALPLAGGLTPLAAAIGVGPADLAILAASVDVLPGAPANASLVVLAKLHRFGRLMNALEVGAAEFLALLRLFDRDPFASPARLAGFVANVDRLAASPFGIADLDLAARADDTLTGPAPAEGDIAALDRLRAALRQVAADNRFIPAGAPPEAAPTADTDGALLRRKLTELGWPVPLVEALADALSNAAVRVAETAVPGPALAGAVERANYSVPLAALPAGVDLAVLSGGKMAFAAGVLAAQAAPDPDERAALLGASADADYQVALADLLVEIQREAGRARFGAATGRLEFIGAMSPGWKAHLDSLSNDAAWRTAVAALHGAPRAVAGALLPRFALAEAAVVYAGPLPVRLPARYDSRLWHDLAASPPALRQRGPLLSEETAALKALAAGADPAAVAFRAALDALGAAVAAAPMGDVFLDPAGIAALFDATPTPEARGLKLLERLMPVVGERAAEARLSDVLAATLEISPALAWYLASRVVAEPGGGQSAAQVLRDPGFVDSAPGVVPNAAAFPMAHRLLGQLRRTALLADRAGLGASELQLFSNLDAAPALGQLPANPLPPAVDAPTAATALLRLADLARLRYRFNGGRAALATLVTAANAAVPDPAAVRAATAAGLGIDPARLDAIAALLGTPLPAAARHEGMLLALAETHDRLTLWGIGPEIVAALSADSIPEAAAQTLLAASVAGLPQSDRAERLRAMVDALRTGLRDALVAYLLARGRPAEGGLPARRWRKPSDLSGHFLADVNMGDCMETSRLRLAMSSCQILVHRAQHRQEPEIDTDPQKDDGWLQWAWMAEYRVWGANVETSYFPENLLFQDIRDDKTDLFRTLEGRVGQGELTREGAARAVLDYLQSLRALAQVRPVAVTRESTSAGPVIHVVGCLAGDPPQFHYRRRSWSKIWSGWQRIDLDIRSEHVLLQHWRGRLFLYWFSAVKRSGEGTLQGSTIRATGYLDVTLSWSELVKGAWTPQRLSQAKLTLPADSAGEAMERITFRAIEDDCLLIYWRHTGWTGAPMTAGKIRQCFRIEYPHAEPLIEMRKTYRLSAPIPSARHTHSGQAIGTFRAYGGSVEVQFPGTEGLPERALARASGYAAIVRDTALNRPQLTAEAFFFHDSRRTFFVQPRHRWLPSYVQIAPGVTDIHELELEHVRPHLEIDPDDYLVIPPKGPVPGVGPIPGPDPDPILYEPGAVEIGGSPIENQLMRSVFRAFRDDRRASRARPVAEIQAAAELNASGGPGLLAALGLPFPAPVATLSLPQVQAAPQIVMGYSVAAKTIVEEPGLFWKGKVIAGIDQVWYTKFRWEYDFAPAYHPYADVLIDRLLRTDLTSMLRRDVQLRPHRYKPGTPIAALDYAQNYGSTQIVTWVHPKEALDFDFDGFNAVYNWELAYHIPYLLADRFLTNNRLEEAQEAIGMILDLTDQSLSVTLEDGTQRDPGAARYWQTKPLFLNSLPPPGGGADDTVVQRERIERILTLLAAAKLPDADQRLTLQDRRDLDRFRLQVEEMRRNPFQPFRIARLRTSAFQRAAAMKDMEIRLKWGDQLYRRDTMEAIDRATLFYTTVADFRGRAAETAPPRAVAAPQTFASLQARLSETGNALVEIEAFVAPSAPTVTSGVAAPVPSVLTFCVPRNPKLDQLWSMTAERLLSIRNCMTIDGVRRRLALFEPRIDPATIARALISGADIAAAVAEVGGPLPRRRFKALTRAFWDAVADARDLGAKLAAAMDQRDSEMLAALRADHEVRSLNRAKAMAEQQQTEAEAQLTALREQRQAPIYRMRKYATLLGDTKLPSFKEGAAIELKPARDDMKTHAAKVFRMSSDVTDTAGAADIATISEAAKLPITDYEDFELALGEKSQSETETAGMFDTIAGIAHAVPNFNLEPWGLGTTFGGSNVGAALGAEASSYRSSAGKYGAAAAQASKAAQMVARADDWITQYNLAALDLMTIDTQIAHLSISSEIAAQRATDAKLSLAEGQEYHDRLAGKETNRDRFDWQVGRLAELHQTSYQMAYDYAKQLQRRARFELLKPAIDVIRYGQWDSLRRGLTAAETLAVDVRRLEALYAESLSFSPNMKVDISLAQVDPAALLRLRATGATRFVVTEALLDLMCPGQLKRQLRAAALTIPAVTPPTIGIHARLTLLRSSIRVSDALKGRERRYARLASGDDDRFVDLFGPPETIVTSHAQNDMGLHDPAMAEDQEPPFVYSGAISEWAVYVPTALPTFNRKTMQDLILTLYFTAAEGPALFRQQCEAEQKTALNKLVEAGGGELSRLFLIDQEEPGAWRAFLEAPVAGRNALGLPITRARMPRIVGTAGVAITRLQIHATVDPARLADMRPPRLAAKLRVKTGQPEVDLEFARLRADTVAAEWTGRVPLAQEEQGAAGDWELMLQSLVPVAGPIDGALIREMSAIVGYTFT